MIRPIGSCRIEGYAVVSDDDRITDALGGMPDALKTEAEWAFFQAGLDAAQVTVLGRKSFDVTPNPKRRQRLILTRSVQALRPVGDDCSIFWNPDTTSLPDALAAFQDEIDHIAVAGGQGVFDYFLTAPHRYTAFHLSRVDGAALPGGTGVFGDVRAKDLSANAILSNAGYSAGPRRDLDELSHVITWSPIS